MKKILFSLMLLGMSLSVWAQDSMPDNIPDSTKDTIVDEGEAGAVQANNIPTANHSSNEWLMPLLAGIVIGAVVGIIIVKVTKSKTKSSVPAPHSHKENSLVDAHVDASNVDANDTKALLAACKKANQDLQASTQKVTLLEQHLEVYRNFDNTYYSEAFRKLVTPLQQALDTGDKAMLMEILIKISAQYSSLTRYKIAKKQPYDEANIHYLINQKSTIEGVPVVEGATDLDKIPKPIKVIMDMLKANESKGLDEVVVAGYKIKNL
jgi:hypothetical protein